MLPKLLGVHVRKSSYHSAIRKAVVVRVSETSPSPLMETNPRLIEMFVVNDWLFAGRILALYDWLVKR